MKNGFKLALIGLYIILEKYVWNLEDRYEALEDEIDAESLRFCFRVFERFESFYNLQGDFCLT